MTKYVNLTKSNLYRAGDAVLTFDKENELSRLSLPMMSLFSKKCSAFSPVKFMQTEEHECQIVIDKDTDCSQIPELNAINYVKGFRILKNPQDLDKVINSGFQDDYFVDNGEELIGEKEEYFIQYLDNLSKPFLFLWPEGCANIIFHNIIFFLLFQND